MIDFITQNISTIIVATIVFGGILALIIAMIRKRKDAKKKGQSPCSCCPNSKGCSVSQLNGSGGCSKV